MRCMKNLLLAVSTWTLATSVSCVESPEPRREGAPPAAHDKPNIVFIMADDLGIEALGSYDGTSYRTPQLDRLAAEGLRFTHAYATPLCTNTRTQVMTSRYNNRNWIAFGLLDPKAKTIGHYLTGAGYKTCIAGKWQLQSYDPPDYPGAAERRGKGMHPRDAGFDEYSLFHSLHTEDKGSRYADPTYLENGTLKKKLRDLYGPDQWVTYINDFMERHRREPFFVYYPMALPHWPVVPTPDSPEWKDPEERHRAAPRHFQAMVEYMDKCVGRIVAKVDDLGLGENTLILFYSDNGTHLGVTSETRGGPVAGGKGLTTNAGTHVPLIARWTGTIEPGVIDDLVDSTDFVPTLMEAAGQSVHADDGLDGVSFFPRLLGRAGTPRAWSYCFYDPRPGWDKDQFARQVFARDKRYKLYEDGRLFDLLTDVLEKRPITVDLETPASREARTRLDRVITMNERS